MNKIVWTNSNNLSLSNIHGFVYIATCLTPASPYYKKYYIGSHTVLKQKGKKVVFNHKWMDYKTSSPRIKKSLANGDCWMANIENTHEKKMMMLYEEIRMIVEANAIWSPDYVNCFLTRKIHNNYKKFE